MSGDVRRPRSNTGPVRKGENVMAEIARTAEEIEAQIAKLNPLTEIDTLAEAAHDALRWVLGLSDVGPADGYDDDTPTEPEADGAALRNIGRSRGDW